MALTSFTSPLTPDQAATLREVLERQGFAFEPKPYALYSARKGKLNVTVYEKGPKVLVQGKETPDFITFTLEPEIFGEAKLGYEEVADPEMYQPHFGIDESGKGDFFGPLVIAGVYTDADVARRLREAGIMDSKRIGSAARIRHLAGIIRSVPGCVSEVVAIGPEKYNEMHTSFGNLNRLLAWGHARVIELLAKRRPDCPRALSDQFARPEVLQRALKQKGITLQLDQRTKGESDIAVAAASILARERFVDWMDKTSNAGGVQLPLGASAAVTAAGKEVVRLHGQEALGKVAKLHFRTSSAVLGTSTASDGGTSGGDS
jgi:ribonuclease HIII